MILCLGSIQRMLEHVTSAVPASRLALHCHDTYGQALPNILTGLKVCCILGEILPNTGNIILLSLCF